MHVMTVLKDWAMLAINKYTLNVPDANNPYFIDIPPHILGVDFVEWLATQPSGMVVWEGDITLPTGNTKTFNNAFWIINPAVEVMRISSITGNKVSLSKWGFVDTTVCHLDVNIRVDDYAAIEMDNPDDVGSELPVDMLDYFMSNPNAYVVPYHSTIANGRMHPTYPLFTYIHTPSTLLKGVFWLPLPWQSGSLMATIKPPKLHLNTRSAIVVSTTVEIKEKLSDLLDQEVDMSTEPSDAITAMHNDVLDIEEYTINGNPLKYPFVYWFANSDSLMIPPIEYSDLVRDDLLRYTGSVMETIGSMLSTRVVFLPWGVQYYNLEAMHCFDSAIVAHR